MSPTGGGWVIRDHTEISFDHWKEVLAPEIHGAFLTMKYALPGMREHGWGRIIHIGLSKALRMERMRGVAPDYCLGKAARAWMATAFGGQEIRRGITVNCVEPSVTAHMSFEDALKAARGDYPDWRKRDNATCHDIAETVAFLCSEAGRFISGDTIRFMWVEPTPPRSAGRASK